MIYLALGSNLSGAYAGPQALLKAALDALPYAGAPVVRCAPFYRSAPVGPAGQDDYVNTVVAVRSVLPPAALLMRLHGLEKLFGRERRIQWGPRTLDVDLVSYHGEIHIKPLTVPHPRLAERAFVLRPLADIAPGWRHPLTGTPVAELLMALPADARNGLKRLRD